MTIRIGRRVARTGLLAACALGALAVYRTTLLPGLAFWDTGEAQTVLPVLGTMHPTGFPAFVVIGWLFSVVARPLESIVPAADQVADVPAIDAERARDLPDLGVSSPVWAWTLGSGGNRARPASGWEVSRPTSLR